MNPRLAALQPYPFERLQALFADVTPARDFPPVRLSVGEPRHDTPACVKQALADAIPALSRYPATAGTAALREAIAGWLERRHGVSLDPARQILPVNGSREALFAFAQCVIDPLPNAQVLCPNPFYQIYEGAALLAGAQPRWINLLEDDDFAPRWQAISAAQWQDIQLLYICSPNNPTGHVLDLAQWRLLFDLADEHGFVIAADECYGEIYPDEANPPLGALAAARQCGREDFRSLVVFSSLSKRSNVPGLRSGFVAGDADLLQAFLRYRTYHGCAMGETMQAASIAAWQDEAHVVENRRLYREKFSAILPMLAPHLGVRQPQAGFYLWAKTPCCDQQFAHRLYASYNIVVLPGSFLARQHDDVNPGAGFVRIALVETLAACQQAAQHIAALCQSLA